MTATFWEKWRRAAALQDDGANFATPDNAKRLGLRQPAGAFGRRCTAANGISLGLENATQNEEQLNRTFVK
jgi:hypothetical protein